jgi:TonB family protein
MPKSKVVAVGATDGEPIPDQNDVRWYRLQVATLAAEFKEYPTMARESGLEGVVGVRLRLAPDRMFPEISLVRSSGVGVLDDAALRMIALAAGKIDVPASMRGRVLSVDLPVDYRLD